MRFDKIGTRAGLALATVCAALGWSAWAAGLPEAQDFGKLEEQLRTMSGVLGEALDRDVPGEWRDPKVESAFNPRIDAEYVPSVGAIFRIPVSFPVIDHGLPDGGPDAEEGQPDDLWEKHASGDGPRRLRLFGDPDEIDLNFENLGPAIAESVKAGLEAAEEAMRGLREGDSDFEPFGPERQREIEERVEKRIAESKRRTQDAQARIRDHERALLDRHPMQFPSKTLFFGGPFEEKKVAELRKVLIQTVAKYGHRLTELPENESIFLIIDAPGARAARRVAMGSGVPVPPAEPTAPAPPVPAPDPVPSVPPVSAPDAIPSAPPISAPDAVQPPAPVDPFGVPYAPVGEKGRQIRIERRLGDGEGNVRVIEIDGSRKPGGERRVRVEEPTLALDFGDGPLNFNFGANPTLWYGAGPRDHYMIRIAKGELNQELKAEDLEGKLEERRY